MGDPEPIPQAGGASRRALLAGAGAVGVAGVAGVLAACGGGDAGDTGARGGDAQATAGPATAGPGGTGTPGVASPPTAGGGGIKTSDVPVGGGVVVEGEGIVVTQPTAGSFKAYDATCTHQGCEVASVSAGKISCPCHGSQFNIADGSVARGPAVVALRSRNITVTGDTINVS
jgi:nitrite reductase/ring-hydroxylating ferredoxin subunit